jgi:hypothetical protein
VRFYASLIFLENGASLPFLEEGKMAPSRWGSMAVCVALLALGSAQVVASDHVSRGADLTGRELTGRELVGRELVGRERASRELEAPIERDPSPISQVGFASFSVPYLNFEGMARTDRVPPDTVGDVGPSHYVQMVNGSGSQVSVYDKRGVRLSGPFTLASLWTANGGSAGDPCTTGRGDPIPLYDPLADRWLLSEFASTGYHLCVYISRTPDPTSGGWHVYDFAVPAIPDYPKYAVWPDAYYVSTNEDGVPGVYALERAKMLAGDPTATFQHFSAWR